MNYKQIYIGVNREVHKYKEDYELTTADVTYWLNKALTSLIDEKYASFETDERARKELWYLYDEASLSPEPGTTELSSNAIGYTFDLSSTNIRYITNERATVVHNTVTKDVAVKPTTLDRINEKIEDPFSEHKVHLTRMKPLKIDEDGSILLISDGNYTITYYKIKFIKNPDLFVILDSLDTTDYSVIPEKLHNELIIKTVRMILENEANPRYQSVINEENKLK